MNRSFVSPLINLANLAGDTEYDPGECYLVAAAVATKPEGGEMEGGARMPSAKASRAATELPRQSVAWSDAPIQ